MVQRKQTQRRSGDSDAAPSPRELVENLRDMIADAERMIGETATRQVDETVEELRAQLQAKVDRLREAYELAEARVVGTAAATDRLIRQKPYQTIGLAAGLGLIAGFCMAKRD